MTLAAASGGIGDELNPPPFPPAAPGPTQRTRDARHAR